MGIRSGKTVGWPMSARMAAEPAGDALGTATVGRRPPGGRIRHGDHGGRHASLLVGETMREAGIGPSMGSIASPWDNAAMEIFDYIEAFYNRVRIHSALGNLSPEEFEARHMEEAAAAA